MMRRTCDVMRSMGSSGFRTKKDPVVAGQAKP
jgi:hypothetical protein